MTGPLTTKARAMFEPVLTWLDAGAQHVSGVGFNMTQFQTPSAYDYADAKCGTACCIAGALAQFNGIKVRAGANQGIGDVAKALGMTPEQEYYLFWGTDVNDDPIVNLGSITPAMAAKTIRHFLATGEVEWVAS